MKTPSPAGLVSCPQSPQQRQGRRTPLAELRKYQIVSLWDMLEFNFPEFLNLMRDLNDIAWICRSFDEETTRSLVLDADGIVQLTQHLANAGVHATVLGLNAAAAQAKRIADELNGPVVPTNQDLDYSLRDLRRRVEDELRGKLFMFIPADKAEFFSKEALFGERVADKFPTAVEDIEEAGKCFAVARFTATVFHLMRVMEIGVRRFASKLGATVGVSDPWGAVLNAIDVEIDKLPHGQKANQREKAKHAKFSEIAMYLRNVKDAVRNETMHPKATYTEEQAKQLFDNVRTFMQSLSRLR